MASDSVLVVVKVVGMTDVTVVVSDAISVCKRSLVVVVLDVTSRSEVVVVTCVRVANAGSVKVEVVTLSLSSEMMSVESVVMIDVTVGS